MCHRADESIDRQGSGVHVSADLLSERISRIHQLRKITQSMGIFGQAQPMHIITGENSRGSLERACC
jgi:hypothetical protein